MTSTTVQRHDPPTRSGTGRCARAALRARRVRPRLIQGLPRVSRCEGRRVSIFSVVGESCPHSKHAEIGAAPPMRRFETHQVRETCLQRVDVWRGCVSRAGDAGTSRSRIFENNIKIVQGFRLPPREKCAMRQERDEQCRVTTLADSDVDLRATD